MASKDDLFGDLSLQWTHHARGFKKLAEVNEFTPDC